MAVVRISVDRYPVYSLSNLDYGDTSELTDNEVAFVKQVFVQFARVQKILQNAFYNADEERCRTEEAD